jgi:hypothetical protein
MEPDLLKVQANSIIGSDRVIVSTPYLIFLYAGDNDVQEDQTPQVLVDDDTFETVILEVGRLLVNLRYISKQFDLPTGAGDFYSLSQRRVSQVPAPSFPTPPARSRISVRKYIIDTSITWEQTQAASTYPSDFTPPAFDTILLDAIDAFADQDYRRAILYSAMSVEIVAATKLDEAYESLILVANASSDFRIISIPQAGERVAVKDPIYEYLTSRTDFAQMLHERPLYILSKSLLVDNESLYQTARKLYRTRNKIVHRGEPPAGEDATYFEMNQPDALAAIECAIEVFKWFGERGRYVIPTLEFYTFDF